MTPAQLSRANANRHAACCQPHCTGCRRPMPYDEWGRKHTESGWRCRSCRRKVDRGLRRLVTWDGGNEWTYAYEGFSGGTRGERCPNERTG